MGFKSTHAINRKILKLSLKTFHDYIELHVHSSKYSLYRVTLSVTYAHLTSETFAQANHVAHRYLWVYWFFTHAVFVRPQAVQGQSVQSF